MTRRGSLLLLALCLLVPCARANERRVRAIEFNRDIRPILSETCFVCHGPDNTLRKGKLRLDQEKEVLADRGDYRVLVPGKPQESELYRRITTTEPSERMPPAKHAKQLSREQIDLIRRWIEEGGKYQQHWSLIRAHRSEPPAVKDASWPRSAIDRFVLARMEGNGFAASAEADRRTLIRRLSFDLTGLPPTAAAVDAFLADTSPKAYEKLVDRLLLSPHHGERLAIYWLDLVRFADTCGYHSDNHRDLWLYRDYVIKAFSDNKRFDQLTIEQLAGDLLPGATVEQKIASGYNRVLQTTEEGGAQPKEYAAKYAADRVRNAGSVWLGLTLGCTECHDHKYDPLTTKEFYRFASFFADVQERAVGRQEQTPLPSPEDAQRLRDLDGRIASLQRVLETSTAELEQSQRAWEAQWKAKDFKGLPKEVVGILPIDRAYRNVKQQQEVARYYRRSIAPALTPTRQKLAGLQKEKAKIQKSIPTTLLTMAGPPRMMRILPRGNWLDDSGEIVTPDVPAVLPRLKTDGKRPTRLDLARWLVDQDNPLVARVFVNRLWMLSFGQGLVKTLDDFGAQGAWPTHPELLDWLAVEFQASGWDVRHLVKLIVTSSTYRQASVAGEALRQRDPYNQYLARQGRWRLDAEFVRDNALAVSGLLVRKVGGPSVKPYQPAGYWQHLNFPKRDYFADKGMNQYRRGMYTHWQRTFPHPSLAAFDAPSREECTCDRPKSSTPQQALVLLNDPTYVEAARAFAERIIREGGKDLSSRLDFAFREALNRTIQPAETKLLSALYQRHLRQYEVDGKAAEALLHVGDRALAADLAAPELAAWTSVARVVLNLHETITRD